MSDLIAIVFPSEAKAEEARKNIVSMVKDYLVQIGDAAIAVKTQDGVKLNQMMNTTAAGAAGGSFWGLLIGLVFLNPLLGVAAGAASGAIAGRLTDIGVNDKFMKGLAADMQTGEAALFLLVNKITSDKALERLQGLGGRVLQTSLDNDAEDKLRAALSHEPKVTAPIDEAAEAPKA
jgi:uncharacterized membrane protein